MPTISCRCGEARVDVTGKPLLRIICHCTLCQRYHQAPQGDLAIFRARDVHLHDAAQIGFQQLRKPPAADRGTCRTCAQPIVEFMKVPLVPKLAFVSASLLAPHMELAAPAARVFYDSRVEDAQDAIPRFSGYLSSELVIARYLLPALVRR